MPNTFLTGALTGASNRLGETVNRQRQMEDEARRLAQQEAQRQQAMELDLRLALAKLGQETPQGASLGSLLNMLTATSGENIERDQSIQEFQLLTPLQREIISLGGTPLPVGEDVPLERRAGLLGAQAAGLTAAEKKRKQGIEDEDRARALEKFELEKKNLLSQISNRGKDNMKPADLLRLEELQVRIAKLQNDLNNPPLRDVPESVRSRADEARRDVLISFIENQPDLLKEGGFLGFGEEKNALKKRLRQLVDEGAKTSDIEATLRNSLPSAEWEPIKSQLDQAASQAEAGRVAELRGLTGGPSEEFRALPASVISKVQEFPPQYQQQILANIQKAYADRSVSEEELLTNLQADLESLQQRGE